MSHSPLTLPPPAVLASNMNSNYLIPSHLLNDLSGSGLAAIDVERFQARVGVHPVRRNVEAHALGQRLGCNESLKRAMAFLCVC